MHRMRRKLNAFSLVELSIVLAIIGLIIGGVIGGQAMIKAARLNKVATEARGYQLALAQFKQKYGWLPGDFPTATQVWGRADGGTPITNNCVNPGTQVSTGEASCNGNGDGSVSTSAGAAGAESFRLWQHLTAAKLIAGKYTGAFVMPGAAPWYNVIPGTNIPNGPLEGSSYMFLNRGIIGTQTPLGNYYAGDYSSALVFGAPASFGFNDSPVLTPTEASTLDTKIDDSVPSTGILRVFTVNNAANPVCTTGTTEATAVYNVTNTTVACTLFFMTDMMLTKNN